MLLAVLFWVWGNGANGDFLWLAFSINSHSFGSRLVFLSQVFADSYVSWPDVDAAGFSSINLPPAFFLDPGYNMSFFPVMLRVASEAMNGDLVPDSNQAVSLVFTYGLDPVLFESPFSASWHDVILFSNLPELPDFELFDIVQQFRNLVESVGTATGLDGYAFFVLGSLSRALTT